MDHDIAERVNLNNRYLKMVAEAPDFNRYNRTEIKKLYNTATQTIAAYNQIQAPIQTPINPPSKPSCSMKMNKLDTPTWSGET